jgi:tellurite resistance protein
MSSTAHLKPLVDVLAAKLGDGDDAAVATVDLAVLVAAADGVIDAEEKAALTTMLEALMRGTVAPQVVRHLIRESKNQIEAAGADARARSLGLLLANLGAADEGLRVALAMAHASDGLSAVERELIATVAKSAGVSPGRFDALVNAAAAPQPSEPSEEA